MQQQQGEQEDGVTDVGLAGEKNCWNTIKLMTFTINEKGFLPFVNRINGSKVRHQFPYHMTDMSALEI